MAVGQLVWVPLRKNTSLGLIVTIEDRLPAGPLKAIRTPVEPAFALDASQLDTVIWLARESACSVFAAASPFLPPGVSHRAVDISASERGRSDNSDGFTAAQARLVEYLREREEVSLDAARSALKRRN